MRIGIDLDGCLANFNKEAKRIVEQMFPGKLPSTHTFDKWSWYSPYISTEDFLKFWDKVKTIDNFWERLDPYVDNVIALQRFLSTNSRYEIFFVTSRAESAGDLISLQSSNWLSYNGIYNINGNYTAVITVPKPEAKEAVLRSLDIKFFIDDKGDTVEGLRQSFPELHSYLLDQPWNCDREYLAPKVNSMQEFLEKVGDSNVTS